MTWRSLDSEFHTRHRPYAEVCREHSRRDQFAGASEADMLKALKSAVASMKALGHPADYGALAMAERAIAKAEGRS